MQICLPDTVKPNKPKPYISILVIYLVPWSILPDEERFSKLYVKKIKQGRGGKLEGTKSWRLNRRTLSVEHQWTGSLKDTQHNHSTGKRSLNRLLLRQKWKPGALARILSAPSLSPPWASPPFFSVSVTSDLVWGVIPLVNPAWMEAFSFCRIVLIPSLELTSCFFKAVGFFVLFVV